MPTISRNNKLWYRKVVLWIGASLLIVLTIALLLIVFSAERFIRNNLSDIVYQKTNHSYRLDFKDISWKWKNQTISFNQLHLKPDTTLAARSSNQDFYEFKTNSLVISNINIKELVAHKKLRANSIKVNNPDFKLSTGQDVDIKMFNAKKVGKGDSLALPLFCEIFIDTILVTDARLQMDTLINIYKKITKVNLEILGFRIGGIKKTDSPFPFDITDIFLKIENLHGNLSDQVHFLTVDEISLSLLHSKINAKNLALKPISESMVTPDNQYHVLVPEIEISSQHVQNFYHTDTIPIENLTLRSPTIEIKFGNQVSKGTPINQINLYKLIGNNIKWVNIDTLSIKNARLKFFPSNSNKVAQQFENLTIDFTQFRVDSNSYSSPDRILSAKELAFSLDQFILNHTDNLHQLVINNLVADTRSRKVTTGIITFMPCDSSGNGKHKVSTLINVKCKGVLFNNVQFSKIYHNQLIPMDELIVLSPNANISFKKGEQRIKDQKEISLILQKMSDYIKGVYVKKTEIVDGMLNYNYILNENENGFFRTKFQFELKGLSLDSNTFYRSEKIFFADNFNVLFKDSWLQLTDNLHRINTDSVILSSTGKNAEIYNFRIVPTKTLPSGDSLFKTGHPEIFDIHFPFIQLTGADLHRAFFQKELLIQTINIPNSTFHIDILGKWKSDQFISSGLTTSPYSLVSDYLQKIAIQKINLENGQLNVSQQRKGLSPVEWTNSFSVKMFNFEIDSLSSQKKDKLLFSDDIDLVIKKYSFKLADGVHQIVADEIGILTTENRLYLMNAKMSPNLLSENFKKMPVAIYADVPALEFSDANIRQLINQGDLSVQAITLSNPKIKLLFQTGIKTQPDSAKKALLIVNELNSIVGNKIFIKNGTLELCNYQNSSSKTFGTTSIDLSMNNFKIVNEQHKFRRYYDNFTLSLKNTRFDFPDKIHYLTIEKTSYQKSAQLLNCTNLLIQPFKETTGTSGHDIYSFFSPNMTMNGFDLINVIDKRQIVAALLLVTNPTFELKSSAKKNVDKRFNPYKIKLYPSINSIIDKIDIRLVSINNAKVDLNSSKPIHLSQMNLTGKSFLVDKSSDSEDRFLLCKNISAELNNFNGKTKAGFYNYRFDKITINDQGRFSLTGISLTPCFSENEFYRRKGYQADYITIKKADCLGQGLNLKQFFEKNEIIIGETNLTFDEIEIYRNNQIPAKPGLIIEMPQKELRDIKQKFRADSILIHGNRFSYRELSPKSTSETNVFFTDLNSTIAHVSNIDQALATDPEAHINVNTKLMGKGKMTMKLDLNIQSERNKFKVETECGPMPLQLMNPVTEAGMNLSIKEGFNNKLTTYFEADEDTATGYMKFSYSDLKISVLNEKKGTKNEDKLISFIANTFAVKSDNPRPGKELIPVKIKAHREKNRSFISYCWNTIYTGMKNSLGMKEKEE